MSLERTAGLPFASVQTESGPCGSSRRRSVLAFGGTNVKAAQREGYTKLHATVARRDRVWFTAITEDGREIQVQVAYRSGKGHHDEVQPGVRVKIYQRP